MKAWLIRVLRWALARLERPEPIREPELTLKTAPIPSDEQMEQDELGGLAARLCGESGGHVIRGLVQHYADRIGHSTMRAVLFEVRRAVIEGRTERPSVLLASLIQRADLDATEFGTIKT